MLARASSDAGTRLRRSKSTSTVHQYAPPISEPFDLDAVRKDALAAATTAFARAQAQEAPQRDTKRSSDLSRSKSNASRKSVTSQGSHFPQRGSSFRSMNAHKGGDLAAMQRQPRPVAMNTEKFPPFYPTPEGPVSVPRPLSAQPSISFTESGRPTSQPKSHRLSASSSVTSQQIRKARSMYYASSVQTGSPIARPPAKYLTTPPPTSVSPSVNVASVLPPTRTMRPSPLAGPRHPTTVTSDETVDQARDRVLQTFQQRSVKHKPSLFLAPFKKRQDKSKEKNKGPTSSSISASAASHQTFNESVADITINDFLPQPEPKEKRSFSGSLRSKFKKVFRRASNKSPIVPVQQIEASRDYFGATHLSPPGVAIGFEIPSPDKEALLRVRSRTPSLECAQPAIAGSGSRSSSNGSAHSNRSLHSEAHASQLSGSRVTSWGTSSTGDSVTQRAMKRLTVIHEAKDSIGSEAERVVTMSLTRKSLPFPSLSAFRDPMPMESLSEETSTPPINPKRVFSALMKEIDASRSAQAQVSSVERTPGGESDVFESSRTKGLYYDGRELHSSASRDFQPCLNSDQRLPSRRPPSAAAQSTQSKTSSIKSFGRVIRSTIRTVTPTHYRSSPSPDRTNNAQGDEKSPASTATDESHDNESLTLDSVVDHNRNALCVKPCLLDDYLTDLRNSPENAQGSPMQIFRPSVEQIEKRVEKAKSRWQTPLDESGKPSFPRETNRNYTVINFAQSIDSTSTEQVDGRGVCKLPASPESSASPAPCPLVSPLSPSVYSRNTDGMSILPNDSVISIRGAEKRERCHDHDGGSAVILTSQSVRSYVVGTPSPRRPSSTRSSHDWKAWLSYEISGMESTSEEELRIRESYATPSGRHRRDLKRTMRTIHTDDEDTMVIVRGSFDTLTPRADLTHPDKPGPVTSPVTPTESKRQDKIPVNTNSPVLEEVNPHPDSFKETFASHTPTTTEDSKGHKLDARIDVTKQKEFVPSTPSQSLSGSQSQIETPKSARMNDRFPYIENGQRSSSNSTKLSHHSKSPTDSVTSLVKLPKSIPSPKVYSDLSAPFTNEAMLREPNTTLRRPEAQHKIKENVTPSSCRGNKRPTISPLGLKLRPKSLQSLPSTTLDSNPSNMGQYATNSPEVKQVQHESSPTATPPHLPRVRATLRPMSPEKLTRRPKSAFDLRGMSSLLPRQNPELRRPALNLKSSSSTLGLNRESSPLAENCTNNSALSDREPTPGQRMADQFLRERKSTTAMKGSAKSEMRGGLRLVREDTPAFL